MRLSNKVLLWSVLNIVVLFCIVGACIAWVLFGTKGILPSYVFQGGINSAMQVVAAKLQYKAVTEWKAILRSAEQNYGVHFDIYTLDRDVPAYRTSHLPEKVVNLASRIPRPHVLFCETQETGDPPSMFSEKEGNGFMPASNSLFVRTADPVRYWYGRTLFLQVRDYDVYYVLLAASAPSISGNGLFFNFSYLFIVGGGILLLSYLWWGPFILHLTKPIVRITKEAERIASGNYVVPEYEQQKSLFEQNRHDEIGRLEEAVTSMSEQLMQRMRGQRRFIRHIAHELGAPLARIRFGLAALAPLSDAKKTERLRAVTRNADELSELVNDLLAYLRSEGLPDAAHLESFSLSDVLRELCLTEALEHEIELHLPEDPLIIHTDLECLRRAVSNVLRNAINYAGEDGPITLSARRDGTLVQIQVEDCGSGVPENELPHLTDVFFRGEQASRRRGGSGLGLSIVKHCMDICKGRVFFSNREPHGFCVTINLPVSPDMNYKNI